jgi:hypothetical protein
MPVKAFDPESEQASDGMMEKMFLAIADGLTGQNLTAIIPDYVARIADARGAFCEIIINESGLATWWYFPFTGSTADPAHITEMVLGLLDAETCGAAPRQCPGQTLKGTVGRALRELGMHVSLYEKSRDDDYLEVDAEIKAINPAKPHRGSVIFTDHGLIRWECRLSEPGGSTPVIDTAEIVETIGLVLTRADSAMSPAYRPGDIPADHQVKPLAATTADSGPRP